MNNCFVQYLAHIEKKPQPNAIDKLVLPRVTGILSKSNQFHYLLGTNCFGNGTRKF